MSRSAMVQQVSELLRSYQTFLREVYVRCRGAWFRIKWYGLRRSKRSLQSLKKIENVLFVCTGNICRSPLAEVYFRSKLLPDSGITVSSAGLDTTGGKLAHPHARMVAQHHGLTLHNHQTTQIVREMVDKADLILVMELSHLSNLLKLCPRVRHKAFVLSEFNGTKNKDIADPFSGPVEEFHVCFQIIRDSCDGLLSEVCKQSLGEAIIEK